MTVSLEDYFKSTLTSTSQKFMEKTSENVIVTSFATNNGSINNKIKRDFLKFSIDLKDGYNILYLILFILLITLCNLVIFVCVKKCINCLVYFLNFLIIYLF